MRDHGALIGLRRDHTTWIVPNSGPTPRRWNFPNDFDEKWTFRSALKNFSENHSLQECATVVILEEAT